MSFLIKESLQSGLEYGGYDILSEIMETGKNSGPEVPVSEKYMLTVRESAAYFNIGIKKMRRLTEDNLGRFAVLSGNRFLIIRTKFELFLNQSSTV